MGCEDRETECVVSRGDRGNRSVDSDPGGESVIRGIGDLEAQKTQKMTIFWVFREPYELSVLFGRSCREVPEEVPNSHNLPFFH
jgi:hypothetical protein